MSWSHSLTADQIYESADVVLEGQILHSYSANIPAVSPPLRGTHYILKTPKVVRRNVEDSFAEHCGKIGFWTLGREFPIAIGASVRVALMLHNNREGQLVLLPVPGSSWSVVATDDGKSLHCHAVDRR